MEIDIVKLLTDVGGPVGVGIALAWMFLRYLEKRDKNWQESQDKRDKQWQDFFTLINAGNKEDTASLTEAMTQLTNSVVKSFQGIADKLAEHDKRVDDRIKASQDIVTAQRKPRVRKEAN